MKIYCVSIMAMQTRQNDRKEEITWVETTPSLIPAQTMEEAAANAKAFAFNKWSVQDGWFCHSAAITTVTKEFYAAADSARKAGILNMSNDEPEKCFFFDGELESEFLL